MPDLDRALRELLTDEHLHLPARADAARIVHDGVRRRRRRRAVVMTTSAAATVGAIVAVTTALPAALDAGGKVTPVQPGLHYDVAWVDRAAPKAWVPEPIAPKPPTMKAPQCTAAQLQAGHSAGNGASGMQFFTVRLRNVSKAPCQLIGRPTRVAAQTPGKPDVIATKGLHLASSGVGGDLAPGKSGYLTVETDRDCQARYSDPNNRFPTNRYSSLAVTLRSNTSFTLAMKLDVECGLRAGGLGIDWPQPTQPPDTRAYLAPSIQAPRSVQAGQALEYVLTLTNPTGATIPLSHCPGYIETLGAGTGTGGVKESLGLDCSTVSQIAPGASVRYEMRLAVPADAGPGLVTLRWSLEAALGKVASTTITIARS
jgi:hypothetical protein